MTDSMYDKLGDLLKAALEKGEIPKSGEKKAETNEGTDERPHGFQTAGGNARRAKRRHETQN